MVGNGRVKWSEVAGEKMWKSRVSLFLLLFCSERWFFFRFRLLIFEWIGALVVGRK